MFPRIPNLCNWALPDHTVLVTKFNNIIHALVSKGMYYVVVLGDWHCVIRKSPVTEVWDSTKHILCYKQICQGILVCSPPTVHNL